MGLGMVIEMSYLWEVSEHLRHLVASFSAAHIDNDVTIGELR